MSSSKSSVPKIIIKARPAVPTEPEQPTSRQDRDDDEGMDEDEDDNDEAYQSEQDMTPDQPEAEDAEEDVDSKQPEEEPEVPVHVPRKRGRPRGRGRGGGFVGTNPPRPRGRPRGRGRGRGRGGATGRPKRDGDDDDDEPEYGDDVRPFRRIQGQIHVIEGDEFVTEDDPKGDQKIDKHGNLLGGRKFKANTFVLPNRDPDRKYMLAIDAARTSGFRDSLYYFRRNLMALKLNATQPEKDYLIAEGKLGSHLRTRSVTLITARSAYKFHGAKMIIEGKWVLDDYYEDKVLAEITEKGLKAGELVGDLPDPNAAHPNSELNSLTSGALAAAGKDRQGGISGGVYRAGGPTTIFGGSGWGPFSDGPLNAVRKSVLSRDGVGEENWMWMMASRVREADEEWGKWRQEARKAVEGVEGLAMGEVPIPGASGSEKRPDAVVVDEEEYNESGKQTPLNSESGPRKQVAFEDGEDETRPLGAYEPHSNVIQYRSNTQPTSARWEHLEDSQNNPLQRRILGGTKAGNGAWALAWVDTVMELPPNGYDDGAAAREYLLKQIEQGELVSTPVS